MARKKLKDFETFTECPKSVLNFETTEELSEFSGYGPQERALHSIEFSLRSTAFGFNLFLMGPEGYGKKDLILDYLKKNAHHFTENAFDWCYVYNFQNPNCPNVISFSKGGGKVFKEDIYFLIYQLQEKIPKAFDTEDYNKSKDKILDELDNFVKESYTSIGEKAKSKNLVLNHTNRGFIFIPAKSDGSSFTEKEYSDLGEEEQKKIQENLEELQGDLESAQLKINKKKNEVEFKLRELNQKETWETAGFLFSELKDKYRENEKVQKHLDDILNAVISNLEVFLDKDRGLGRVNPLATFKGLPPQFEQFDVNLLVGHESDRPIPIIYEDLPSFNNLLGRIEYQAQMGIMITSFKNLKPGSLHKANGGFLIVDAKKLLMHPFSWDALKRTLFSREIKMEPLERQFGFMTTVSLEPESIKLDLKVILVGDRRIYYLLKEYDPEFSKLFKVEADFEESFENSLENLEQFNNMLGFYLKKNNLLPLTSSGVARVIEESMRRADSTKKLSTDQQNLLELLQSADLLASGKDKKTIDREDIEKAIEEKRYRSRRIPELLLEKVREKVQLISTTGKEIGQINGLSVIKLGNLNFGHPNRITAQTWPGKGDVVDIEREVELSGPIHSKGILILSGFLRSRYRMDIPLCLTASLVFEQNYGGIEGDSATLAEACALVSSLSDAPIFQGLAVTGSMNQKGEVQAIGGVNEKIEGFFELCMEQGLSGEQGVIIPESNVQHLMLREEVRSAIRKGQFHIYAITHFDDALPLLMEKEAGERNAKNKFPRNSINGLVIKKLKKFSKTLQMMLKKNSSE